MKIKILFLAKDYRGGIETFVNQIRNISRVKYGPYFAFATKDAFGKYHKDDIFLGNKYPNYHHLSLLKVRLLFTNFYYSLRLIGRLKPDLIVVFPVFSMVTVGLVKIFFPRTKVVVVVNTNLEAIINKKPGKIYQLIIGFLIKHLINIYDKIVFTSSDLYKNNSKKYKLDKYRCQVIEHSVDLEKIEKKLIGKLKPQEMKVLKKKRFKIFSVGRLERQKDFRTLIRAFGKLHKRVDKTDLIIIGDGPQKQKLKKLALDLGVSKNVHFLGWKTNVYKYLQYADVFVLSSFFEGFGMVLIEAMAMGVPVVSTNTPYGPREILESGKHGLLVPMRDSRRMFLAILKLIKNKKLRNKYSKLGLLRVRKYDTKTMLKKFEKLFLNLTYRYNNYE